MFPQTTEPPDAQASFAAACYVDTAQARISYLSRSLTQLAAQRRKLSQEVATVQWMKRELALKSQREFQILRSSMLAAVSSETHRHSAAFED